MKGSSREFIPAEAVKVVPGVYNSNNGWRTVEMTGDPMENELLDIVYGYRKAQLLYVAAKLGISTILAAGPRSSDELARETNTNPDALYRVLRALSTFGIYRELPQRQFELTEKGALLWKDGKKSVYIDVVMRMEEYNWKPWGDLLYSVQTGESVFEKIFGMNLFQYLTCRPEASRTFSEAMGVYTRRIAAAILESYDFSPHRVVADIGGSNGDLLRHILSKNAHIQGILFDLPDVIRKIQPGAFGPDIAGRLTVAAGSFFEAVPSGCDLYIMKKILHDWDDDHSLKILQNCFDACPTGGRILLVEQVLDLQGEDTMAAAINDIHMLVQTIGGRERTRDEYYDLLSGVGFKPIAANRYFVEAVKE